MLGPEGLTRKSIGRVTGQLTAGLQSCPTCLIFWGGLRVGLPNNRAGELPIQSSLRHMISMICVGPLSERLYDQLGPTGFRL